MIEPTFDEVHRRAVSLFAEKREWPTKPVVEVIRMTIRLRGAMSRVDYLALQSVLMSLAMMAEKKGRANAWPPMPPEKFSRVVLADERFRVHFHKFVIGTIAAEATADASK